MGRKKSRPLRSNGLTTVTSTTIRISEKDLENGEHPRTMKVNNTEGNPDNSKHFFVEVDRSDWSSAEHFDIAEVVLEDINLSDGYEVHKLVEDMCLESRIYLRFRLPEVDESCFRLGHFSALSAGDMFLEFYVLEKNHLEGTVGHFVVLSGNFDGPGESICGLVHLVSQKLLTVRPILEAGDMTNLQTIRLRVQISRNTFDACGSLMEIHRQPWRKSMLNVMSWLRPDVTTSEAKYQIGKSEIYVCGELPGTSGGFGSKMHLEFDVDQFYEAIKPSKEAPMLENMLPDLTLQLRPYQRRAAYWMVQREKELPGVSEDNTQRQFFAPLCVPVTLLDGNSSMFYNPFCGAVALREEYPLSRVSGGILADEMGLGKTVELLACIFSHRMPSTHIPYCEKPGIKFGIKRVKRERVECICGAVTESYKYKGLWVQCDICDAWQHADCVGFLPKKKQRSSKDFVTEKIIGNDLSCPVNKIRNSKDPANVSEIVTEKIIGNDLSCPVNKIRNSKDPANVSEIGGGYTCSLCSELIEATCSTVTSSATLIVCPSPILAQWYSEIIRHTRPGSLKICIYEGAKFLASPTTLKADMTKLASSDIVLTTYDVLKEDLSHDSDRHDGDRRSMRFKKRYPVVPTLLTRINWWRLCLDEAQMVESNTAPVTEMALRLCSQHRWCITGTPIQRKLDDVYGLLRFLSARPFDVYRWWTEVIRNPYEKGDMLAKEFAHSFFKQIMWRSSKAHVSEELGLPPQEECMVWLSFSPVEEHFYRKQHETCMGYAQEALEHFKDTYMKENTSSDVNASCDPYLSHNEASRLLSPLLKLRQACCHPQVGSSGLRSLQQSPMTMDEILEVLINKTKIEGEEALRKIIIALNGLAAIAIIEQEHEKAFSLYKEALMIAAENSENFRIDPLLSLHIHHNLADLFPVVSEHVKNLTYLKFCSKISEESNPKNVKFKLENVNAERGTGTDDLSGTATIDHPLLKVSAFDGDEMKNTCNAPPQVPSEPITDGYLRQKCDDIKQKHLSVFLSKLSLAQQEFRNSHRQVCDMFTEFKEKHEGWWLQTLEHIEQKEYMEGLTKKINQAISGSLGGPGSSRVSLRFRSITSLKYTLQTGLDSLEASRRTLVERLMEIDKTMDKPREEDIGRVQSCPNCQSGDGLLCLHCELDDLFQLYEARLFRLKKGNSTIASAEEAIDFQKKKNELNLFFRASKMSEETINPNEINKGQRHGGSNVVVSRSPSDLEVVLGVIKGFSKSKLGRDGVSSAGKQLLLLEWMRKEFAHARSLSRAQAQMLRAYDEINMSTSRLRLKEIETEPAAMNILSKDELIPSSMQFSSDKFMSLSFLARIKGQLRYLKGLMLSKQNGKLNDDWDDQSEGGDSNNCASYTTGKNVNLEPCPICHEKLGDQKMVFQCGHVTCCKCYVELTEQAVVSSGKSQQKWVMCPTCRQHTDFGNVAYVDDRKGEVCDKTVLHLFQGQEVSEMSIKVEGSYGTKVEAVIRRILWISSIDQEAKLLVFSSWNDVLDVLEHSFRANDISYVRMKGGRKSQVALAQFKGQSSSGVEDHDRSTKDVNKKLKSIQVMLLLVQHGSNGLNLLEAQHVILVEPLLNPATEAQAINRVHRIGQEKKTFVHRFLVKNTVEESIYKLNGSRTINARISPKSKHLDQPRLTLRDIEILYSPITPVDSTESILQVGSLSCLSPSVAAGLAAERRLMQSTR